MPAKSQFGERERVYLSRCCGAWPTPCVWCAPSVSSS